MGAQVEQAPGRDECARRAWATCAKGRGHARGVQPALVPSPEPCLPAPKNQHEGVRGDLQLNCTCQQTGVMRQLEM